MENSSLDAHLDECPSCVDWSERAHALARSSLHLAEPPRARSPEISTRPRGFHGYRWLRIALGWAGLLLVVTNLPGMFTDSADVSAVHLSRHLHAFSAALGLTFLFVSWRPDRAYGLVPFAATFTVALSTTAVIDLVNGASTASAESPHLIEIAGLAMLWVLGAQAGPGKRTS